MCMQLFIILLWRRDAIRYKSINSHWKAILWFAHSLEKYFACWETSLLGKAPNTYIFEENEFTAFLINDDGWSKCCLYTMFHFLYAKTILFQGKPRAMKIDQILEMHHMVVVYDLQQGLLQMQDLISSFFTTKHVTMFQCLILSHYSCSKVITKIYHDCLIQAFLLFLYVVTLF